jgi:hypothetical protein
MSKKDILGNGSSFHSFNNKDLKVPRHRKQGGILAFQLSNDTGNANYWGELQTARKLDRRWLFSNTVFDIERCVYDSIYSRL